MQLGMIDDKIVAIEKIGAEFLDRGTFFGDGVYEVLRSYNGRIFSIDEHIARFERSLEEIEITGVDIREIKSRVLKAFEKAGIGDAKIYFHITRGSGLREHLPEKGMKPNFFLTVTELKDKPKLKQEGVAVSTYPDIRWKRCDIKSLNLLANVMAKADAAKKGCWEAIFVNEDGVITEGAGSAFFGIVNGKLRTSPLNANILPSITRKHVLEASANIGLPVEENSMTTVEARIAGELFLAVTTRDIIPVVKFDGQIIGTRGPGRLTKQLIEEFRKLTV